MNLTQQQRQDVTEVMHLLQVKQRITPTDRRLIALLIERIFTSLGIDVTEPVQTEVEVTTKKEKK